jgi:Sel1 repeat
VVCVRLAGQPPRISAVDVPAADIFAFCYLLFTLPSTGQEQQHPVSTKAEEEMLIQRADKGDTRAQSEIITMAEKGDPRAEAALGDNYEYGIWVSKNHAEALQWYRKAAQHGDSRARATLGQMYFDGEGVKQDFAEAACWFRCPVPSEPILESCRIIRYSELPPGARELLTKMKCEVRTGSNYDYGSAVDLDGNGIPAYQFCCSESPHGPCGAVVVGKVGGQWKNLTAPQGALGIDDACGQFIVLESQHNGFHDVCLPNQCSTAAPNSQAECLPTIWQFDGSRYWSVPSRLGKP